MGRINRANIKKAIYYLKRNGVINTWYAAKERMEEAKKAPYRYMVPEEQELERQRTAHMDFQGVISIVVPTYHTGPEYLRDLVDSVLQQTYPHWELVLADASKDTSVWDVVKGYSDKRIRYIRLGSNEGIAQNTNGALEYVTGEYVGLLDHDDVLTADALYEIARVIEMKNKEGIEVKMLYSDEDKCNSDRSEYYEPNFKESFNLDLLLSNNYICHFMVMESAMIKELGFRAEYNGAQDYDLVLRAAERLIGHEEQIVHVPKVLYHWRCHIGSTAENPQSKQYAYEAGLRALQDFADRLRWKARAEHLRHLGFYQLVYESESSSKKEKQNNAKNNPEITTRSGRIARDILECRKDLGAVGGNVICKGKIIGGRMTEEGTLFYEGLPIAYSGYLHRAVLTQDAEAVDIRAICIRRECVPVFEKITGVMYKENPNTGMFDFSILPKGTNYQGVSIALGKELRKAGYKILYHPSITVSRRSLHG